MAWTFRILAFSFCCLQHRGRMALQRLTLRWAGSISPLGIFLSKLEQTALFPNSCLSVCGTREKPLRGEPGSNRKHIVKVFFFCVSNFSHAARSRGSPRSEKQARGRSGRVLTSCSLSRQSGSGAVPGAIPYRRPTRPRPAADLSEEETKRIARIFSTQLSKKE